MDANQTNQLSNEQARKFALAGNATFTVVSKKTGERFTYTVKSPKLGRDGAPVKKEEAAVRFVNVRNGAEYSCLGTIFMQGMKFVHNARRSPFMADATEVRGFDWVFRNFINGTSDQVVFLHAGTCGRCGRELTDPKSIAIGLGTECVKHGGGL